ncbi:MAG TPA: hypothetical protein VN081_02370 [Dongiaceae bacterium]|nr:hypothetical protein [Dongiaceae bacterium]
MAQLVTGRTDSNNEVPVRVDADGNIGIISGEGSASAIGNIDDPAYTDATGAADGTMISLLKGCYVQLAAVDANTLP